MISCLLEKAAETQFQNLRNRYGHEKRKLKKANKTGAGTKDLNVRLSEHFPYLSWIVPCFVERQTGTNFKSRMHLEDEHEEEQDGDDNICIASLDVYINPDSLEMLQG